MTSAIQWAEKGILPDTLIKYGIRKLLSQRLTEVPVDNDDELQKYTLNFINELKESPIAVSTTEANQQHYELPPDFFVYALGKNLKYSSAYYDQGAISLDEAEDHMLQLYVERAEIKDGMKIMDLGCGWGSFSLFVARKFPNCQIRSVSNSALQRDFIEGKAKQLGLDNIQVTTADINSFDSDEQFDRIVSVEMFEHMRNYEALLGKIAKWLNPGGKLFVHIFCHKSAPYYFETEGEDNWMGAYFFTGGIMPSNHLLLYFQNRLAIDQHWVVSGTNYSKTALAWLHNQDMNKEKIMKVFTDTYGADQAHIWFQRWRIFFLSCAELFGYNEGKEWYVSHYLFAKDKLTG